MKISRISIFRKSLTYVGGRYTWGRGNYFESGKSTVVMIETDNGLQGVGEFCPCGENYMDAHSEGTEPPPVFDSADILENPTVMVKAFCDSVEIPFIESALSREPGAVTSTYSWWDGGSFHENLKRSTGFVAQPRKYVEISAAPDRVRQVHHRVKPHYDYLYSHRIYI